MGYDSRKWDIVKSLVWDIFPGNGMRLPEMGFKKSLIWDVIFIEINVNNYILMDFFTVKCGYRFTVGDCQSQNYDA